MTKPNQNKPFSEPDKIQSRSSSEAAKKESPEFHPLADIFPLMQGADFHDLCDDIKKHGLREPVTMFEGNVLDGRNRWRACESAGVEIPPDKIRQFNPALDGDPVAWVISINLKRRHLDESQRAYVAANIENMRQGERTDLEPSANLHKVDRKKAADMLNVSERSVASAATVRDKGEPELKDAVEQGKLKVSVAADATKLPAEAQREIGEMAKAGEVNAARNIAKKAWKEKQKKLGATQAPLPDNGYDAAEVKRLARTTSRHCLAIIVVQLRQQLKAEKDKNESLADENLELQSRIHRMEQAAQLQDACHGEPTISPPNKPA